MTKFEDKRKYQIEVDCVDFSACHVQSAYFDQDEYGDDVDM